MVCSRRPVSGASDTRSGSKNPFSTLCECDYHHSPCVSPFASVLFGIQRLTTRARTLDTCIVNDRVESGQKQQGQKRPFLCDQFCWQIVLSTPGDTPFQGDPNEGAFPIEDPLSCPARRSRRLRIGHPPCASTMHNTVRVTPPATGFILGKWQLKKGCG